MFGRNTTLLLTTFALGQAALAAEWIAFDNEPPGTMPTVTYVAEASTPGRTVLDVELHGLWHDTVVDVGGQGGLFDRIRIPGGSLGRGIGRPEVPGLPILLALTGGGLGADIGEVKVMGSTILQGLQLAPAQPYVQDSEKTGGPNDPLIPFIVDQEFYAQHDELWPPGLGEVFEPRVVRGDFRIQPTSIRVAQYNPGMGELVVNHSVRVVFEQPDDPIGPTTLSRRLTAAVMEQVPNAMQMFELVLLLMNEDGMNGNYLVITPEGYVDNLWPLITQKIQRGYRVTIMTVEDIGTNPTDIKTEIEDWWNGLATDVDAYCLLVGDDPDLPMHPDVIWSSVRPSDYWYACIEDDVWASFGIGRLSVDSDDEVDEQIEKILAYEESPPAYADWYNNVHMTVHWNTSHGFTGSADAVEALTYPEGPLDFTRRTGTDPSDTEQDVMDDIDEGQHFLLYFGHGNDRCWASWTAASTGLCRDEIELLENGSKTPIVYSAGCQNSSIHQEDDCNSEYWMNSTERAVAHIGATRNYWRPPAGMLGKWLLWFSYQSFSIDISTAILYGQCYTLMESGHDVDAYRNLYETQLLGDPEMRVWTENPNPYTIIDFPTSLPIHATTLHVVIGNMFRGGGGPPPIVAVSMNGESLGNAFANAAGEVDIPLSLTGPGTLTIRAWNDLAQALDVVVAVQVIDDACTGDLDGNNEVDVQDILLLIAAWGDCPAGGACAADLNGDGTVAVQDVLIMIGAWGVCP
ncbi:MAG: C25 family cysteine peptidase [Phycisphaerales bacterium]|jgi:hypothetical protein|nr:C25 family cysteine peptidase [Phycisphaerales bacterium]